MIRNPIAERQPSGLPIKPRSVFTTRSKPVRVRKVALVRGGGCHWGEPLVKKKRKKEKRFLSSLCPCLPLTSLYFTWQAAGVRLKRRGALCLQSVASCVGEALGG